MTIWLHNNLAIEWHPQDHTLADAAELGWRIQFDPQDADHLARRLDGQITDRLMEAIDAV
jgi:hypothetical protein